MKTREITFRGLKADGSSEWVYGDLVNCGGLKYIIPIDGPSSVKYLPKQDESYHTEIRAIAIKVIPETVGQLTGLTDRNGERLYEGDTLHVGENLTCEIVYIEKNEEDYGDEIHCAFHAKVYQRNKIIPLDSYLKNNCVLIGNIHQR